MCNFKSIYKSLIKKKKRSYEYKKLKDIERLRHCKPKDFWKLFTNKNKGSKSNNITNEAFYNYFSTLDENLPNASNVDADFFCNNYDFDTDDCSFEELDKPITVSEIEKSIKSLKKNKAYAGDLLLNEYFIESCDILASHLVDIFNGIFNSGHFPDNWSEAIMVPIYKKNDPDDVNNYRGISLVSCLSKIFTGILNKRLNNWVDNNNIVSDAQFGFRRGRSTVDAIFVLNAIIQRILSKNERLACAFVDLRKAFDSIYRNALYFKLNRLGVNAKMLRIIRDMYTNVKACVRGCNSYSEFFKCAIGLKQGEVISPLLYSLFLEDLELYLCDDPNCGLSLDDITFILMLFADDMVILGKSPSDLQNSLNMLHEYCKTWGLEVNTDKTKVVVFRKRGGLKSDEHWSFDDKSIEVVNDINYMGTVFNYTGNYSLNQETLAGKGLNINSL